MTESDRPAAALYIGSVMHARMKPIAHRFRYEVFSLLVDLNRLDDAAKASALFSIGRWNLLSFHERDHGPRDGSSLVDYVARILAPAGVDARASRIELLCYPRLLGLVFNPLSVYFVWSPQETLQAVIYEVRNTFGEHHSYVAPVRPGEWSEAGLRQSRAKTFYVSPFNGMAMAYHFRLRPPGDDVAVRILETDAEGPLLAATFHGQRQRLTTGSLLAALVKCPLLTAKVVGGIHWEALQLWIKGLRLVPRPAPPPPLNYGDGPVGPAATRPARSPSRTPALSTEP